MNFGSAFQVQVQGPAPRGAERAASILCDVLIEALRPLTAGLGQRLSQLLHPEGPFDAYCVMEEFARRVLVYVLGVEEAQQCAVLAALYAGFVNFVPIYAECEVTFVRKQFVQMLDGIAFSTTNSNSTSAAAGNNASLDDELFGADGDTADAYGLYGERILAAADRFRAPVELTLTRSVRFVGGVQI